MGIVAALEIWEESPAGLPVVAEGVAVEQLAFQRGEESFTHGVVVAVPHRSHGKADSGHRPTEDATAEDVNDHSRKQESRPRGNLSDIGYPQSVRLAGREGAIHPLAAHTGALFGPVSVDPRGPRTCGRIAHDNVEYGPRVLPIVDSSLPQIGDLNDRRPGPGLCGRTAREVFMEQSRILPSRNIFREEVKETEKNLLGEACSRRERAAARRQAVEAVPLHYGLSKKWWVCHPNEAWKS